MKEALKTDLGDQYAYITYAGEWNDVVTNQNPTMDGRGIRASRNNAGQVELHFGTFKNNKKHGWGIKVLLTEPSNEDRNKAEGDASITVSCECCYWNGEVPDTAKTLEV